MIPSSLLSKFLKQGFSVAFISAAICSANLYAGPTGDAVSAKESKEDSAGATTLSDIAEREMVRRLQRVKDAEIGLDEGQALEADNDFDGARAKYKSALENIPRAPLVK